MKTDNYAYDELEGFKPLKVQTVAQKYDVWMSMYRSQLSFSKAARDILWVRDYLTFAYNEKTKELLVASSPDGGNGAMHLTSKNKQLQNSKILQKLLEKVCRYDLGVVRIRIPGTPCRTKRNAVIFHLEQAQSVLTKKAQK